MIVTKWGVRWIVIVFTWCKVQMTAITRVYDTYNEIVGYHFIWVYDTYKEPVI